MELLTSILTFIGFFAVTFGAAGHISRWLKENDERKRTLEKHNASVISALSRIEATLDNNHKNNIP